MAASSVTGTGPGESFGKQKPELHSGCGCCGGKSDAPPAKAKRKTSCITRHSSSSGVVRYSTGSGTARVGSCI